MIKPKFGNQKIPYIMYSGNCFVKGVFQLTIFYKICKTDFTVALPVALQNDNIPQGAEYMKNR